MIDKISSRLLALARDSAARNPNKGRPRALIIPPAIPGSLGDAAMVSASAHHLKEQFPAIDLLFGKEWPLDEKFDRRIPAERYFYKGSVLQKALLVKNLSQFSHVFLIGADVIDGAYNPRSVCGRLSLLEEAANLGNKATLLGSSYNKKPESTTRAMLKSLPKEVVLCARDPVSKARMEDALDRPIRQTADLAFLLSPRPDDTDALKAIEWIKDQRRKGNKVIGLNANYLQAEKNEGIPAALPKLIERLLKDDLSIVMVPHDTRSKRPDEKLLSDAAATLPIAIRERLYMFPPKSPGAIKAVLANLDMIVSGRMHAAILAMGSGTPAYSFAYQDKFEGLYSFFDLHESGLLSTPEALVESPETVADNILRQLTVQEELRRKIISHLPSVLALSRANFA